MGFSSVGTIPVSQTTSSSRGPSTAYGGSIQWKPNLERVGRMAVGESLSVKGTGASYVSRSAAQPSSERVRKLYQQPPASQRPPTSVITPSSWRVGKELTDQILRQDTHSPPPKPLVSSQSSYSESHSLPDISMEHDVSSTSSVASLPPQRATSQPTVGLSTSVAQPTVGLSSSVARLLEDLEMSSQDGKEAPSDQGLRPFRTCNMCMRPLHDWFDCGRAGMISCFSFSPCDTHHYKVQRLAKVQ